MQEPDIVRESRPNGDGRYVIRFEDGHAAELTYFDPSPDLRVMDHTRVPKALEGRGIASRLAQRAVEDAKLEGKKVRPDCSYIAAWLKRHSAFQDLISA